MRGQAQWQSRDRPPSSSSSTVTASSYNRPLPQDQMRWSQSQASHSQQVSQQAGLASSQPALPSRPMSQSGPSTYPPYPASERWPREEVYHPPVVRGPWPEQEPTGTYNPRSSYQRSDSRSAYSNGPSSSHHQLPHRPPQHSDQYDPHAQGRAAVHPPQPPPLTLGGSSSNGPYGSPVATAYSSERWQQLQPPLSQGMGNAHPSANQWQSVGSSSNNSQVKASVSASYSNHDTSSRNTQQREQLTSSGNSSNKRQKLDTTRQERNEPSKYTRSTHASSSNPAKATYTRPEYDRRRRSPSVDSVGRVKRSKRASSVSVVSSDEDGLYRKRSRSPPPPRRRQRSRSTSRSSQTRSDQRHSTSSRSQRDRPRSRSRERYRKDVYARSPDRRSVHSDRDRASTRQESSAHYRSRRRQESISRSRSRSPLPPPRSSRDARSPKRDPSPKREAFKTRRPKSPQIVRQRQPSSPVPEPEDEARSAALYVSEAHQIASVAPAIVPTSNPSLSLPPKPIWSSTALPKGPRASGISQSRSVNVLETQPSALGAGFKKLSSSKPVVAPQMRKFFPGEEDDANPPFEAASTRAGPLTPPAPIPMVLEPVSNPPLEVDSPIPGLSISLPAPLEGRPEQIVNGAGVHKPEGEEEQTSPANDTAATTASDIYERLSQVGEGTYGKVYKARNMESGELVALKRIRMEAEKDGFPVTSVREIKLLQSLRHPNVIALREMMVSKGAVFMVFDYLEHDLTGVLRCPDINFSPANCKSLMQQLLHGLAYIHNRGVLHRDLKGSNILLGELGDVKIADFGLARFYQKDRRNDYTNRVITQWYKPPELLYGSTIYGAEVDVWSAGCIFLELFTCRPIFQGQDEIHQLDVIYRLLGTPDPSEWPDVIGLPWYELVKPKEVLPKRLRDSFGTKWLTTEGGLQVAEALLALNPRQRPTADEALQMPYFTTEEPLAERPSMQGLGEWHEWEAKLKKAKGKR